jgi:hypothetical protein
MWWSIFNDHQRTMVLQTVHVMNIFSSLMLRPRMLTNSCLERPRRTTGSPPWAWGRDVHARTSALLCGGHSPRRAGRCGGVAARVCRRCSVGRALCRRVCTRRAYTRGTSLFSRFSILVLAMCWFDFHNDPIIMMRPTSSHDCIHLVPPHALGRSRIHASNAHEPKPTGLAACRADQRRRAAVRFLRLFFRIRISRHTRPRSIAMTHKRTIEFLQTIPRHAHVLYIYN